MSDERAMSEDDIETMAWELESKMMEIRKDPRAALTAGLARIRATMLAETKAYMAEGRAKLEAERAKREAELDAQFAAAEAELDALMFRLRQVNTREEAQQFCSEIEARHAHRAETKGPTREKIV